LIAAGLRWRDIGTGRTNWCDIHAVMSTRDRTSATTRVIDPEASTWKLTDHLLALLIDYVAIGNWQRGGGKGRKPRPVPRPGAGSNLEQIEMDSFDTPAAFDEWWATH
jgi:hypothetical protein